MFLARPVAKGNVAKGDHDGSFKFNARSSSQTSNSAPPLETVLYGAKP
jgi:hypothetical protein